MNVDDFDDGYWKMICSGLYCHYLCWKVVENDCYCWTECGGAQSVDSGLFVDALTWLLDYYC